MGKFWWVKQLGTGLACGMATWCPAAPPVKVLYWACEDDHDQLWRRQAKICAGLGVEFSALDNFKVDARHGMENTLLSTEFGRPLWTGQIELLHQQVNDLGTEVLIIDNIGHPFGATGGRLTITLLREMRRREVRFGLVTMCVGGGMGSAGIFERMT